MGFSTGLSAAAATKFSFAGRHVVLGVSGGIASYKACAVARELSEGGMAVDVVMTASAAEFVRPVTFEALTGRRVVRSLWDPGASLDHVRWARESDLVIVAPATAHTIARAAQGLADDFLTAMLLACTTDVLVAPAMNDDMFAHAATQENIQRLVQRGWQFIGPAVGPLAEGGSDRPGRMEEPEHIVAHARRLIRSRGGPWRGRRVLVTAGPTREPIDPVRVITNRSSGLMGYAVARAAYERGADVRLISGPTTLSPPWGVETERVETTREMLEAVSRRLPEVDLLVMAAAPADYRLDGPATHKHPRTGGPLTLRLEPTPDILMDSRDARKPGSVAIGFALETSDGVERARAKLERKALDLIALNFATEPGAGFESPTNRITLVSRAGVVAELPMMTKDAAADKILDAVESAW